MKDQVEDLYVDFKIKQDCASPLLDKDFQHVLSKAISGFANADGGVIVLGVDAPQNKAPTLELISPVNDFEQEVNTYIPRSTSFPVSGVETKRLLFQGQTGGVVLVYVPKSDLAPHRSMKDHRYYQRIGDSFMPMEHYQVADMFGRRHQPRLTPYVEARSDVNSRGRVRLLVGIKNVGVAIAKYIYLSVDERGPFSFSAYGVSGNGHWGLPPVSGQSVITEYRGGADHVIHPGIALPVTQLEYRFAVSGVGSLAGDVAIQIAGRICAEGVVLKGWRVNFNHEQIREIVENPYFSVSAEGVLN
ncbi:helix-turn-helix domain-containing protein [Myxococcus hansupus]|uniref:AlbA family DNA-binding domain-containing protein n=1 Tax=Pseudomyxococcus hansupus TaxID=1297742 RepID=UPI0009E52936|nr:ATP-binding protein [Myxococcus hansupus]